MQQRISPSRNTEPETESLPKVSDSRHAETDKTKTEADELLDAIDDLLEDNAAEFLSRFVQTGGQ